MRRWWKRAVIALSLPRFAAVRDAEMRPKPPFGKKGRSSASRQPSNDGPPPPLTLHVDITGDGPDLVLLHGWGLHGGLWGDALPSLAAHFCVHAVDLPGHGYSAHLPLDFSAITLSQLAGVIPQGATVLGWSLGGMLAQALAVAPANPIGKLVLLSTTPRFTQAWDWPHGIESAVLQGFSDRLQTDYHATVLQFLALQALGSKDARRQIAALREAVFTRGEAPIAALTAGLSLLAALDLRPAAHTIRQPTLVLAGARDTLTPLGASRWLANTLPHATLRTFADGAHALYFSHTDAFVNAVRDFTLPHHA